jgi:hypothetical protein
MGRCGTTNLRLSFCELAKLLLLLCVNVRPNVAIFYDIYRKKDSADNIMRKRR